MDYNMWLEDFESPTTVLSEMDFLSLSAFQTEKIWEALLNGNLWEAMKIAVNGVVNVSTQQKEEIKNIIIMIVIIGALASFLLIFAECFRNSQVTELAYTVVYMVMSGMLMQYFKVSMESLTTVLDNTELFIKMVIPTYAITVGSAVGSATASSMYAIMLIITLVIESLYVSVFIPVSACYVLLGAVNGLRKEERLTIAIQFLEKIVNNGIKITIGIVSGIGILQSLLAPAYDAVQKMAVKKAFSVIPGIGKTTEGVFDMIMGTAVLVKNSMGIFFTILLFTVCLFPILRIFLVGMVIKAGAAVVGAISDKRLAGCIDHIGEGHLLLTKIAVSGISLFFVQIAILAMAGGRIG